MPRFGVYFDKKPLIVDNGVLRGQPNLKVINMRGDPFTDTLRIEY